MQAQQEEKLQRLEEKERDLVEGRKRREAEKMKEEEFKRTLTLKDSELQSRDDAFRNLQGQTEQLCGNLRRMDKQLAEEKNIREERENEIDNLKRASQFGGWIRALSFSFCTPLCLGIRFMAGRRQKVLHVNYCGLEPRRVPRISPLVKTKNWSERLMSLLVLRLHCPFVDLLLNRDAAHAPRNR